MCLVRREAVAVGRAARWLLLACTLIGLAVMHVLGHGGPHAVTVHSHGSTAVSGVSMSPADLCAGDGCLLAYAWSSGSGHGASDWSVCLAVLGGLGLVVMALLLGARAARGATPALGSRHRWGRPRAPPGLDVGLTLATVSVLRR